MQCGNPLFLEWIGEWMESARESNNHTYYVYRKAYESMARYPTRFSHPMEAICLSGVGEKIAARLESKLIEHCRDHNLPPPVPKEHISRKKVNLKDADESEEVEARPKKARKVKQYIPSYRSGAYAIMLTLLDAKGTPSGESLTKYEITTRGQAYCDASMTNPDQGKFFTAWSSMSTLMEKNLVYKSSSRYYLTEEGVELAKSMRTVIDGGEAGAPVSSLTDKPLSNEESSSRWESRVMEQGYGARTSLLDDIVHTPQHKPQESRGSSSISLASGRKAKLTKKYSYTYDDDVFDAWDDTPTKSTGTPSSTGVPGLESIKPAGSSSTHSIGGNRDQPVNILSDSDDDDVNMRPNVDTFESMVQSLASSSVFSVRKEIQVTHGDGYLAKTSNSTISSGGLKRSSTSSLLSTPAKSVPSSHPAHNTNVLDGYFKSNSSESLGQNIVNPPGVPYDSFPHLRSKSFKSYRSASGLLVNGIKEVAKFQPIEFHPGEFEICLILDVREVRTQADRDYIGQKLKDKGVNVIKRALDIGDVAWIARLKEPSVLGPDEIVLDYILERKRMDDLVHSIKDGRFNEQKFRLRRSGLGHVVYLIETHRVGEVYDITADGLRTAMTGIQIHDNFFVRRTNHTDHSIDYLVSVTNALKRLHESKTLYAIPDELIQRGTYLDLQNELKESQPDRTYLTSYKSFGLLNGKFETVMVKDVFVKMLMTIRGVSSDKALEIASIYKTPRNLFSAIDNDVDLIARTYQKNSLTKSGSNINKKRKISPALSAKIARIWCTNEYPKV
ncbi:Crossover junction endonuclease mus81 [Entomortierella beljakovae]|nr:Crossover junction endonuclease mus81 [Entomortierella beljakovae]